jgi:uncharacterized protein (TIGR00251 family)
VPVADDPGRWWTPIAGGIELTVRVTPGARRSEVVDATGSRLRLRVAAPATEGKANAELERLLARLFDVRPSAVKVIRGARARDKVVQVAGVKGAPPQLS